MKTPPSEPAQPSPVTPADPVSFRYALGRLAKGVAVATTLSDGHDHAMTVDTLMSVSLDPLLVLVCVENDARFRLAVEECGLWGVSILAATARDAASWFASRGRPLTGQLDAFPFHRDASGVALLDGALATLSVTTSALHPAGDHTIVVGRVEAIELPDTVGDALVFYRGQFTRLS